MRIRYPMSEVKKAFHAEEPWANVFFFKFITLPLAYIVVNFTNITANFVTLLSLVFGALAFFAISEGSLLFGIFFYLVSYIMDAIDGKIVRLTSSSSKYGAWFDIFVDRLVYFLMVTSLMIYSTAGNLNAFEMILYGYSLWIFMVGFESRYNIQNVKLISMVKSGDLESIKNWRQAAGEAPERGSPYQEWCRKTGVHSSPFTLVEALMILFVIAPLFGVFVEALFVVSGILTVRLLNQQRFWLG